MRVDPRVTSEAELVIYYVQTNESIHLSDKSRHDIHCKVQDVAGYWKKELDEIRERNDSLKWNELNLWIRQNRSDDTELLEAIEKLKRKEYTRGWRNEPIYS